MDAAPPCASARVLHEWCIGSGRPRCQPTPADRGAPGQCLDVGGVCHATPCARLLLLRQPQRVGPPHGARARALGSVLCAAGRGQGQGTGNRGSQLRSTPVHGLCVAAGALEMPNSGQSREPEMQNLHTEIEVPFICLCIRISKRKFFFNLDHYNSPSPKKNHYNLPIWRFGIINSFSHPCHFLHLPHIRIHCQARMRIRTHMDVKSPPPLSNRACPGTPRLAVPRTSASPRCVPPL